MFKRFAALRNARKGASATSSSAGATRRQVLDSRPRWSPRPSPSRRPHWGSSLTSSFKSMWSDTSFMSSKWGWAFVFAVALQCDVNESVFNDSDQDASATQRRLRYYERTKANKGGILYIPRPVAEEEVEEAQEEQEAEEADPALEAESVETIAAVVAEDPGATPAEQGESEQQGAYDPETGTINWDCPCLGGMAHGPCGEQFKAAFSCFIYSEQEPKGVDCVDKFKTMQDCFRAHPDVYQEELAMDEQDEVDALVEETEAALGIERPAL